jgi:hypothetical protein
MKNISRIAALALLATGAFLSNHAAANTTTGVAMKSAAPVPTCPPNDPKGCGIGNF